MSSSNRSSCNRSSGNRSSRNRSSCSRSSNSMSSSNRSSCNRSSRNRSSCNRSSRNRSSRNRSSSNRGSSNRSSSCCHRFSSLLSVLYFFAEKWLCRMVTVDEMQLDFMPERGTMDAVFILRRLQEDYHAKGKQLYV